MSKQSMQLCFKARLLRKYAIMCTVKCHLLTMLNIFKDISTFLHLYTQIFPTRWHNAFQTGIWAQAVEEQVQSALRGK